MQYSITQNDFCQILNLNFFLFNCADLFMQTKNKLADWAKLTKIDFAINYVNASLASWQAGACWQNDANKMVVHFECAEITSCYYVPSYHSSAVPAALFGLLIESSAQQQQLSSSSDNIIGNRRHIHYDNELKASLWWTRDREGQSVAGQGVQAPGFRNHLPPPAPARAICETDANPMR